MQYKLRNTLVRKDYCKIYLRKEADRVARFEPPFFIENHLFILNKGKTDKKPIGRIQSYGAI